MSEPVCLRVLFQVALASATEVIDPVRLLSAYPLAEIAATEIAVPVCWRILPLFALASATEVIDAVL